ncbi:MAG: hypothetical protein HKN37_12975 [Rhodothermales bacterium]|nr:hypothetical protein [Rhodothermales bacterium]
MQFLMDNIVASIVGATVLLMMVATHHRNQVASAEATSFYMLQQQVLDFTSSLQRDMQNVSSVNDLTEKTDSTFSFMAQVSPTDTTKRLVTYRRKKVESRYRKDVGTRDYYQIERLVAGVVTGGSIGTITAWDVRVLNEEGNPASAVGDARQIRISLEAASPVDVNVRDGVTIRDTRWQSTFRPRMLRDSSL